MSNQTLTCNGLSLDLSKPNVMGILNITPDSFFDGGQLFRNGKIDEVVLLKRVEQMLSEGADILDIGGESTRPGASVVELDEELDRVVTAVNLIRKRFDVVISVDTSSPEVMKQSVNAGAGIINDIRALQRENAVTTAAELKVPVVLMHMQGEPSTMQKAPEYTDIVGEVRSFLLQRAEQCKLAGIESKHIILDLGFGFGKTLNHNLSLMKHLSEFTQLPYLNLVGVSRKSMIGQVLNKPVEDRLVGGLSLAVQALNKGAKFLRVHDVGETVDAVKMFSAVEKAL